MFLYYANGAYRNYMRQETPYFGKWANNFYRPSRKMKCRGICKIEMEIDRIKEETPAPHLENQPEGKSGHHGEIYERTAFLLTRNEGADRRLFRCLFNFRHSQIGRMKWRDYLRVAPIMP